MPIDYLKIYKQLMADVLSVKVRQNLLPYVQRLLQWESVEVFPYACTISPKSSPLLKHKPLLTQYNILSTFIKQTIPLYSNKYFFSFETYKDNENIHCHGFVNFRTLTDIKKFKKDNRQSFNISLKPHERDCLTDVKLLGNDETARKRWIGYCYKEMSWSLKNDIPPIYRWDDAYVKPIEHPKKKKVLKYEVLPIIRQSEEAPLRKEYLEWKNNQSNYILESEEEDESEQETTQEYLQYLRLKSKFEKKNL